MSRQLNTPKKFVDFYRTFGQFLKEGAATDLSYQNQLAGLLRFESSATAGDAMTSFAEYIGRMTPEQSEIYYLIATSRLSIERGPYIEGFRARGLEVIFCYDPVDEYVMSNLRSFDGKSIVAADYGHLTLPSREPPHDVGTNDGLSSSDGDALLKWLGDTLDERIVVVRASQRLVDSPALAVSTDRATSPHIRRMLRSMKRPEGSTPVRVDLEINMRHPIIKRLVEISSTRPETATLVAQQLLDNALLSAALLDDPSSMVDRLNKLLELV